VLATGLAVLLVDRYGRKILLMLSGGIMAVSITALGVYFYMKENKECTLEVLQDEDPLFKFPPGIDILSPDFDFKSFCKDKQVSQRVNTIPNRINSSNVT